MEAAAANIPRKTLNPYAIEFRPQAHTVGADASFAVDSSMHLSSPFPPLPPILPPILPPNTSPGFHQYYLTFPPFNFTISTSLHPSNIISTYDPFLSQLHLSSSTFFVPDTPTNSTHTHQPLPPPSPPSILHTAPSTAPPETDDQIQAPSSERVVVGTSPKPSRARARAFVSKWLCKDGEFRMNNYGRQPRQTKEEPRPLSRALPKKNLVQNYCKRMGKKEKSPPIPVKLDGCETTVMIRNIPNQYSREELIRFLDNYCRQENGKIMISSAEVDEKQAEVAFDFVYLPIDFGTRANRGFAFVNFTDPRAAWKFHLYNSHNQRWEKYASDKMREISCAKIQGKQALIDHFEKSIFACGSDEYLPVCFNPPRDGSGRLVAWRSIGRRV
ncbi:hypothetical protein Nepgr_018113 [Nepenthes gracilis]|uniref:RRM domain-containing protein n=1 Tax=Nepenthes gracilis TaxID=150966 RepID=A0AAD3XSS8_NEPGR|nr:hypothetical protein Nepgr_018113 [Nepenthes gracilis]